MSFLVFAVGVAALICGALYGMPPSFALALELVPPEKRHAAERASKTGLGIMVAGFLLTIIGVLLK